MRLETLENIFETNQIFDPKHNLKNAIESEIREKFSEEIPQGVNEFLGSLSNKLRHRLSKEIFKDLDIKFPFLKKVSEDYFLTWLGLRLVPRKINLK